MNLSTIEKSFSSYLEKNWELNEIAPFLLVYIRLLLLFKNELSLVELNVVLERQKQLLGEEFTDEGFDELRDRVRDEMDRDLGDNTSMTRRAIVRRLLYCALLDVEENDFFYLTEPVFEFVRNMEISPVQLTHILESEFVGLKIISQ